MTSEKALLFEKRSKNFCSLGQALNATRSQNCKSFLVLFFKKELLAFALLEQGSVPMRIKTATSSQAAIVAHP